MTTYAAILAFLMGLKGAQLVFIVIVVLLLFGAGRIPSIMRNLGKGIHSFKQGIEDAKEEINREVVKAGSTQKKPAEDDKPAEDTPKD